MRVNIKLWWKGKVRGKGNDKGKGKGKGKVR